MKRDEWIDKLQTAWGDVNGMMQCFSNVNFYKDEGETAEEAQSYISMVQTEIENFDMVLNEINEKLEILQNVINEERDVEE